MIQYFRYVGARGELELLPLGEVVAQCLANGERVYELSDLDELLAELRESRNPESSAAPATDKL